jgi:hypothetical protein
VNLTDAQGGYVGCGLYELIKQPDDGEAPPEPSGHADNDFWKWIYDFKLIENTAEHPADVDNSAYKLSFTNFADEDENGYIVKDEDQQRASCYLNDMIEFAVPAWIRLESDIKLMDTVRSGRLVHASYFNIFLPHSFAGMEPYTLTVLPQVGFGRNDNSVVTVTDEFGNALQNLQQSAENDDQVILGESRGGLNGYYWTENYGNYIPDSA